MAWSGDGRGGLELAAPGRLRVLAGGAAGDEDRREDRARDREPGADAARSMVDMIASMRAFEAGQKVIQAIDETLGQAVTKVGAVGS